MNLNTRLRHEVFKNEKGKPDSAMIDYVAGRIADSDAIARSRQFPYQFLAASLSATTKAGSPAAAFTITNTAVQPV